MALAESITLPPPTASIKSTLLFLQSSIPFLTKLNLGLGLTPPSSITCNSALFKESKILSYNPFFLILPLLPPQVLV